MGRVICPQCGYCVGLGMAAEIGRCPSCEVPLMLTCEFRALSTDDLKAAAERQERLAAERTKVPRYRPPPLQPGPPGGLGRSSARAPL